MAASTDRITTDVFIAAPPARVWELITTAEHLGRWFGDAGATIDLRPGGALSLSWSEFGTVHGRVETVEPPSRFAFRWLTEQGLQVDPTAGNSTLVGFTVAAEADGTRLTVVESGFDTLDLDPSARTARLAGNTAGWRKELGELVVLAEAASADAPR
jgi:uncharacterized protein YndB with AHSA1/START domain